MHDPSLRQLRTFLFVVQTGGVTTAAQALGLTQPAASQQLRELERAMGVRLLERVSGRSVPTAAGRALIEPARRAQAAVEDARAVAAAHRSGEAGRVRLGTGATACIHLLPPVLAELNERMPGLEVIIATGNTPDILRRVEEGDLDAALVTLPAALGRSLTATRVATDPLVALLPEAMAPSGRPSLTAADLERLPLILYETGANTRAIIDAWFRRAGLAPRPIMELGSVEAIKVLVAGGRGCSVLPALALGGDVAGAVVRPLRPALARQLAVVLRKEKVVDRGLGRLRAALKGAGGQPG
ncbi:LysR family transcriptional regulator [Siccirubricoccus sp. KC 17139]|uniref:LysR family transcriptional regulator n=1 Tax=Siccirubricoccus soli TaxID=2899147 RepID=A0ABT1D2H0_9PROT|nr:LysR family transcriptional regulator [Siccirubricoccus soli]MCO6416097.1 LysR family transcriptional regulator [Siccirubricoccus soli]MCP2682229.1 LysR family transcriptional regulator [Siccirubricoccus soli]